MKIRIGFVTNSSSSSYVCIHADNPVLYDLINRLKANPHVQNLACSTVNKIKLKHVVNPDTSRAEWIVSYDSEPDAHPRMIVGDDTTLQSVGQDVVSYLADMIHEEVEDGDNDWMLEIQLNRLLNTLEMGTDWSGKSLDLEESTIKEYQDRVSELEEELEQIEKNKQLCRASLLEFETKLMDIVEAFQSLYVVNEYLMEEGDPFYDGALHSVEYEHSTISGYEHISKCYHQEDGSPSNEANLGDAETIKKYRFSDPVFNYAYSFTETDFDYDQPSPVGVNPGFVFAPKGYERGRVMSVPGKIRQSSSAPFMASFPHFIEIDTGGGHWTHDQRANQDSSSMAASDFEKLISEIQDRGSLLYLSDGDGSGEEPVFKALEDIVGDTDEDRSLNEIYSFSKADLLYYSPHRLFLWNHDTTTQEAPLDKSLAQILFVLDRDTLPVAISRLQDNTFPEHVEQVFFLFANEEPSIATGHQLTFDNPLVIDFFRLARRRHNFDIRVNAQAIPLLHKYYYKALPKLMEPCEGGRFSAYISPDMKLHPCKYCLDDRYAVSLKDFSIEEAWNSDVFQQFREAISEHCPDDFPVDNLTYGCPLMCKDL